MKYKLIATDMDGTLNNDNFEISEKNKEAVRKALEAGLKVVLCSGRSPVSLHGYEEGLGLNTEGQYGIGFNGSTVYETWTKNILFGENIHKNLVKKIVVKIKEIDTSVKLALYLKGDYMLAETGLEDILTDYNTDNSVKIDYFKEITPKKINTNAINIYVIEQRPKLDKIYKALENEDLTGCTMAFTQKHLLEFMPQTMNKAEGLSKLCEYLKIPLEEVVTVGDNYNDIEMIQAAGLGVAVANAVQALKDSADYVTKNDNNNNAFAELIDLILSESL